jgi:23S rRNA pseudouridine1911/1915/1917 synthase
MKTNFKILYEDNHIIVIVKPKDILSQADNTNDIDIMRLIKAYLKDKYNKPGNVFLGLVHRLDRRVSGVMVFAKTSKAASRLSNQIKNQDMNKAYYAITTGEVEDNGKLVNYIKKVKDGKVNKAIITNANDKDAKEAVLEYKRLKTIIIDNNVFSLVYVNLITGRYNQIRAQFANIYHPLINDFKYGYKLNNYDDDLGLACVEIGFFHPITKEYLTFNYLPKEGIWSKFL